MAENYLSNYKKLVTENNSNISVRFSSLKVFHFNVNWFWGTPF